MLSKNHTLIKFNKYLKLILCAWEYEPPQQAACSWMTSMDVSIESRSACISYGSAYKKKSELGSHFSLRHD